MTHPLTPRENLMRPIAGIENRAAQEVFDIMSDRFRAHLTALASGSGDQLSGNPGILKSGSGDHAELARLAEDASSGPWSVDADDLGRTIVASPVEIVARDARHNSAFIAAANPATVLALLAEIAALRAQSDFYKRDNDVLMKNTWVSRAAEAERKLAEAVGLLKVASVMFHPGSTVGQDIRTYLSKEAERG